MKSGRLPGLQRDQEYDRRRFTQEWFAVANEGCGETDNDTV
jgi:hypothetical protein